MGKGILIAAQATEKDTLRVGHIVYPPFHFSQSISMDADLIRSFAANAKIKEYAHV